MLLASAQRRSPHALPGRQRELDLRHLAGRLELPLGATGPCLRLDAPPRRNQLRAIRCPSALRLRALNLRQTCCSDVRGDRRFRLQFGRLAPPRIRRGIAIASSPQTRGLATIPPSLGYPP
jgi:hypothetical protein